MTNFTGFVANFIPKNSVKTDMNIGDTTTYDLPKFAEPIYYENTTSKRGFLQNSSNFVDTTLDDGGGLELDGDTRDNGDIVLEDDTNDVNTLCPRGKVYNESTQKCICPPGMREIVISNEPAFYSECRAIQESNIQSLSKNQKWGIIIVGTAAMYYLLYKIGALK